MSIDTSDKIYFAYTPYIHPDDVWEWGKTVGGAPKVIRLSTARATIALRIIGDNVHYGIAVCSEEDNFNKLEGRALAEARLKSGFGKFPVDNELADRFTDLHEISLYFLRNMVNSVEKDIRKTQQKIHKKKQPKEPLRIAHSASLNPTRNNVT